MDSSTGTGYLRNQIQLKTVELDSENRFSVQRIYYSWQLLYWKLLEVGAADVKQDASNGVWRQRAD